MDTVETRLRAALRAYQDAATEAVIVYYGAAGGVASDFPQLERVAALDLAASEIRDALGAHLADGGDPLTVLLLEETHAEHDAETWLWLHVVAADLRARLAGEDRPVPVPGQTTERTPPKEQMQ